MRIDDVVLGSDPEFFLSHADGSVFPAWEFLPSKYEPIKTNEPINPNSVYFDGWQAEETVTPSVSIAEVIKSIKYGLMTALRAARKKDKNAKFSTKTVVEVTKEVLDATSDEYKQFGCAPSYNVWGICGKSASGETSLIRPAGGHVHFGLPEAYRTEEQINIIVKALDSILGVTCVSLMENLDNPARREYYGLAGEMRMPEHGCEYRVLSCAWIFSPKVAAMVLDLARRVVVYATSGKNQWEASEEEVIETILLCDAAKARGIIERNKHCFEQMGFKTDIDLMRPVEESIPNMLVSIEANWGT